MDGAVDAAAAEQRAVGGVDDGVDVERGDVGDEDVEPRRADFGGEQGHAKSTLSRARQRARERAAGDR